MVNVVVGGKVDPEVKARLIKEAGANGKTVNAVIRDLVNDYLDEKDKLTHPTKYIPSEKSEKLEIVPPEDETIDLKVDEEMPGEDFLNEMWDTFRDYARDRGYTLVKTDSLKKLLAFLKKKTKVKEEDEFECPACHHTSESKFKYCPECGEGLIEWED